MVADVPAQLAAIDPIAVMADVPIQHDNQEAPPVANPQPFSPPAAGRPQRIRHPPLHYKPIIEDA
jgi:hypothetical protein